MKKYFFFILISFSTKPCVSQKVKVDPNKDWLYNMQRSEITEPTYSLEKIEKLIAKNNKGYGKGNVLFEAIYRSLSFREKFTYNMIHAESYGQICSISFPETEPEKKIFGQLPDVFGEYNWSSRQIDYFKSHKDSVTELIKLSISSTKKVGLNYKTVIEMINATKTIPLLINTYNINKKDHDILTLLMLLMKENKYAAFRDSQMCRDLYGSDQSNYRTFISFNLLVGEVIIKLANDFYNALPK